MIDESTARAFDKLPPSDIESEMCLLASMMIDESGTVIPMVKGIVGREAFYQADHQIYFDVLLSMHAASRPVDSILLRNEMVSRNLYEEVGGDAYLAQIINKVPSAAHGVHYANIVREKHLLRGVIQTANEALRRAYGPTGHGGATGIASALYGDLAAIACSSDIEKIHRLSDVAAQVLMSRDDKTALRYSTAMKELDATVGGLPRGRFTQIGGRPAMGKSLFCKQVILNIAGRGIPCGIVSVEETEEKIAQNYLSNISGVENRRIAYNTLIEEEVNELIGSMATIDSLPIHLADEPVRLSEVESTITTLAMKYKCEVVMVDYLQLITLDGRPSENENREITQISKSLKSIFKKLNIAGIVPVQLNRGNETGGVRKPTLRDLRGSGSLEQDGDLIILLHREDYYHKGEPEYQQSHQIEAIVAKNKDGPTGIVPLYFNPRTQSIHDWDKCPQSVPYDTEAA